MTRARDVVQPFFLTSVRDSRDSKARTRYGVYSGSSGREDEQPPLCQAAVSEGVTEEKAALRALISDTHFNLPSFVHNPGVFSSSASVVSYCFLNRQDTVLY